MVDEIATDIISCFKRGRTLFIAGCGGSASMSSHFAGELVSKFERERKALPALSLTDNTAVITAIANDYSFDKVYSRQLEAYGKRGDLLITLSTSGESKSILEVIKTAEKIGIRHIEFPSMKDTCKVPAGVKSGVAIEVLKEIGYSDPIQSTANLQLDHLDMIHLICRKVEEAFL